MGANNRSGNCRCGRLSKTMPTKYFESDLARVWLAKRRAILDVWLACIASVLNLDDGEQFKT